MALGLSRIRPLCKDANGVLGLALRESSFEDANPTCSSTVVLDTHTRKWRCRPVRVLYEDADCIIA